MRSTAKFCGWMRMDIDMKRVTEAEAAAGLDNLRFCDILIGIIVDMNTSYQLYQRTKSGF